MYRPDQEESSVDSPELEIVSTLGQNRTKRACRCFLVPVHVTKILTLVFGLGVLGLAIALIIRFCLPPKNLTDRPLPPEYQAEYKILITQRKELQTKKAALKKQLTDNPQTRAQRDIDTYCKDKNDQGVRICKPCAAGWISGNNLCYLVALADPTELKNYDQATKNCSVLEATLAIVRNPPNQWNFICQNSLFVNRTEGYWIGLRLYNGNVWRWADGTMMDKSTAIWQQNPNDPKYDCAQSRATKCHNGWTPYPCSQPQNWICQRRLLKLRVGTVRSVDISQRSCLTTSECNQTTKVDFPTTPPSTPWPRWRRHLHTGNDPFNKIRIGLRVVSLTKE